MLRDRYVNDITVTALTYEIPLNMDYVYGDATAGAQTFTLKRTHDKVIRRVAVMKVDAGADTVTVTDGTLSFVLSAQFQGAVFEQGSDGLWRVFSSNAGGGGIPTFSFETPTGAVDGVNDEFVFSVPPVFVTYQGVIQTLSADYTLAGSTATFAVPPVSGSVQGLVSL